MADAIKLSDRVRAGSEAAPWVVEEIKKLEAALAEQPAQGEAVPADVQRVIDRLMSSDPDFDDCEDAANMLRRLAKAPPAPAVPAGWKMVPVKATPEMVHAACVAMEGGRTIGRVYAAMLAAAPGASPCLTTATPRP